MKYFIVPFFVIAIVFSFTCCIKKSDSSSSQNAGAGDEIVFGEFGSMSGAESTFGTSTHKGIMMAVDAINRAGGIKGKKIKVLSEDDQGRSDEAVTVVTKLATQQKIQVLLGEVASSRSIAAAPIAQQYRVPMISPSSTNPKVTQLGDYIFRVCFIDPFQGAVMARFAFNNLKLKRAAVFRDTKSDYSVGLANFFVEEYKRLGGTVVTDVSYSSGDVDFKSQLTAIKSKNPEAVFVPGYYTEVGLIARQARELKFPGTLLGGDGWDSAKLSEIGGKAVEGNYFSSHYSPDDKSPVIQKFVAEYKALYGGEVPNGLAAMGFDAASVAADAVRRAPDLSPKAIRDAIATTKNFQGVTGVITINEDRNAVKPAVVLKVAGRDKYEYVTTINP